MKAAPTSLVVALPPISGVRTCPSTSISLLGDMLELGDDSVEEHVKVLQKAKSAGLCKVFFVGGEFAKAVEKTAGDFMCFATSQELADWLSDNPLDGATVLIKGSRGTRMEKVIPVL